MTMETKWGKSNNGYAKIPKHEQKRKNWIRISHQNDCNKYNNDPVDIKSLFRSDGLIHGICL